MREPSDFNLLDEKVQKCPYDFYSAMREKSPVYQMPETGYYIVSTYDLCMEAIRKVDIFSSKMGFRVNEDSAEVTKIMEEGGFGTEIPTLVTNDPPTHTRYRALVNTTFTAQRVKELEPYIDAIIEDQFNGIGSADRMEVVSEFCIPVPMKIIADQLGFDRAYIAKFKEWSDAFVEPLGNLVTPERHIEIAKLMVEFQHYFADLIMSRKNSEEVYDDILAGLMSAEVEGEAALDTKELLSILSLLLVAGNETTTNTLTSGFLLLCRNPSLLDELYEDPSKAASFAEEVLRLEAPVQGLFRMATEDTELGGTFIPKGSYVNLRYGSANRDESMFNCPANMDLERKMARRHLSFGSGIHSCIGAQLARKEIEATFRLIAKKLSHIELAVTEEELEYQPSFILRGLKELPVKFVRR